MRGNVVWTIADRPHYTEETLTYWRDVRGVNDWNHVFFVEPGSMRERQMEVLMRKPFKSQQIVMHGKRQGVLRCAWEALEGGFEGKYGVQPAEFCVLAEEDLAVSDDVLELFDRLSDELQDSKTAAICMNGAMTREGGGRLDTFVPMPGFDSHIWGTWRPIWRQYLRETWDFDYSSGNPSGWDWNMTLRVFPQNGLHAVRPQISRSDNLGQYGGVHQAVHEYQASRPPEFHRNVERQTTVVVEEMA
jgi:hypothetical protein